MKVSSVAPFVDYNKMTMEELRRRALKIKVCYVWWCALKIGHVGKHTWRKKKGRQK